MSRGEKKTGMINVRFEAGIMAAIVREADTEDRSLAAMTRILVKEALAARLSKKGPQIPLYPPAPKEKDPRAFPREAVAEPESGYGRPKAEKARRKK